MSAIALSTPLPDPRIRPTLSVPEAGSHLGIARDSAYRAARRGEIPTIHVGRRVVVPTAALWKMLGLDVEADARNHAVAAGV